jgi:hypothetical protein
MQLRFNPKTAINDAVWGINASLFTFLVVLTINFVLPDAAHWLASQAYTVLDSMRSAYDSFPGELLRYASSR